MRAPAEYDVKFVTTAGDFTIKVTRAWAPNGADRFYNLVRHHFYDGAAFFRVLPGFMAQFGLSAYPEVSKAWEHANDQGRSRRAEQSSRIRLICHGRSEYAHDAGLSSTIGNNEALDKSGFSPFAMVTDGMEVVDKLYSGYGEGAPDGHGPGQDLIGNRGHAYLEKEFSQAGQH